MPVNLRALSALTVVYLAVFGVAVPPAGAVPAVPVASPRLSAVLVLQGDTATLHALAARGNRRGSPRLPAPAAAHRTAVLRFARSHHLDVVRTDAWSVTVAAPAATMAQAFGATLHGSAPGDPGGAGTWATDPAVPTALRGAVQGVAGLDNRQFHRSHVTTDGADNRQTSAGLRAAYDVPSGWQGAGITVGTVNLAGWDPGDLKNFAQQDVPAATGVISQISVDGADPLQLDGSGGESEVALDAEAILGAAPAANQRMYFAPNSSAGVVSAFNQIATDVENHLVQVVSTSWGSCEKDFDTVASAADRLGYQTAIDRIVAAGGTLFAASGDASAYDCSSAGSPDNQAQVDFPASYENTVAVGGTTVTAGRGETGWHDPGAGDYLGDGSGGGESVEQAQPAYQQGLLPGRTHRLVPDVAADADPQSGLRVYVATLGGWTTVGGTSLAAPLWAGDLASALSAAATPVGIGNILPALYLRSAQPNFPGLRDVVAGNNGLYTAAPGYDLVTGLGVPDWAVLGPYLLAASPAVGSTGTNDSPPPPAAPMSDPILTVGQYSRSLTVPVRVTVPTGSSYQGFSLRANTDSGCAGQHPAAPTNASLPANAAQGQQPLVLAAFDSSQVCHIVRGSVFYDSVPPVVGVTAGLLDSYDTRVRIRLTGSDRGSGLASWLVTVRDAVTHQIAYQGASTTGTIVTPLRGGRTFLITAVAVDRAGNTSSPASVSLTIPLDDTAFSVRGSWNRLRGATDFVGTHLHSLRRGSSATLVAVTRGFQLIMLPSPHGGYADVAVDGRVSRIDLFASRPTIVTLPVGGWTTAGRHTITVTVLGRHRKGSLGNWVDLDGIGVLR